jgi:hypothetical protein
MSNIDIVVAGEGEATMLELANGAGYEEVKVFALEAANH